MEISDLYDYLHFKQNLLKRSLPLAAKCHKRHLRELLKKYERMEETLDFLCEESLYFNID